jgi:PhnB protein
MQNNLATIQTYLNFDGVCDQALDFYSKTIGAEVVSKMRFKDSPDPNTCSGGQADKVMHAAFKVGNTLVMASDGRCTGTPKFDGFHLTINAANDAEAAKLFAALSDGGQVMMPLGKTFFASSFGMLKDRFGVHWMVLVVNCPTAA